MGSFKGHALPGSFFFLVGLWWTGKYALLHATRRNKNLGSFRLASRATQRRLEVAESCVVILFSVVGENVSVFHMNCVIFNSWRSRILLSVVPPAGILAEQFAANGPRLHLYDSVEKHWAFLMNWQHSTMYLFFGLAATVTVILHTTEGAPVAIDRLMLAVAFFNEGKRRYARLLTLLELLVSNGSRDSTGTLFSCVVPGFLFLYHLHGRSALDVHVHQLLLYAIFGVAIVAALEVFQRGNIILELLRCCLTVVQGTWFWQIGFVLYPPGGADWDQKDVGNMMFITMCYSWHLAFSMLIVALLYSATSCGVRFRLKNPPPMEMGLLKPRGREAESEEEI
ncbi:transmembrane protein 45A isoform X4 [Cynoglossus semilaevis]|nr:transmembrane protein 45A isoform X4 [Cynoglossus semilaevis]